MSDIFGPDPDAQPSSVPTSLGDGVAAPSPFDAFATDAAPTVIDDTPSEVAPVKGEKFSSVELIKLIEARYPTFRGEFAVYEQVGNSTGHGCSTWVDAVVLGLWPSSGLVRRAFEVKISRSDFLRELNTPGKNQFARENCHEFWFVAPAGVIKPHEVPEGDGWLAPRNGSLVVQKQPTRRTVRERPEFIAALGRAAFKTLEKARNRMGRDYLENDPSYKIAKAWQDAGSAFIAGAGQRIYRDDYDTILNAMRAATADVRMERDKEQVAAVLARFKDQMVSVAETAAMLAAVGITAADQAGDFVIEKYGSREVGKYIGKAQRQANKAMEGAERHLRGLLERPMPDPTNPV